MSTKDEAIERHRRQLQEALKNRRDLREEAKDDAEDGVRELREYIEDEVGKTPWIEHVYQCIVLRIQHPHVALVEAGFFGGPINALFGDRKPLVGFKYELRYPSLGAVPWIKVPSAKFMYFTSGSPDRKTMRVMRISWPPLDPKGEPEYLCTYKGMREVYQRGDYLFNSLLGVDGNGVIWTRWQKPGPIDVLHTGVGGTNIIYGVSWWPGLGAGEESSVYWLEFGAYPGAVDSTQQQSKIVIANTTGNYKDLEYSVDVHEEVNLIGDDNVKRWVSSDRSFPIFSRYHFPDPLTFSIGELNVSGQFRVVQVPGSYEIAARDAVRYSYDATVIDNLDHKVRLAVNNEPAEQLIYRSLNSGHHPHIWTDTAPDGKEITRIAWACHKYSQPNEVAGPSLAHYQAMGGGYSVNIADVHWIHHKITLEFPGLKSYELPRDPLNCFVKMMSCGPNEENKTVRFTGWWAPNQAVGVSGKYSISSFAPQGDPRATYPLGFNWSGDWGEMGGARTSGPWNNTAPTGQQVLEVFQDGVFGTQSEDQPPISYIIADSRDGLDLLAVTYGGLLLYSIDGGFVWYEPYKGAKIEDPRLYGMGGYLSTAFIVEL